MRLSVLVFLFIVLGLPASDSLAQIISQTPSPQIPQQAAEDLSTLKPVASRQISGTIIQVPRAGALLFASFDVNADYKIDTNELKTGLEKAFIIADRDKSGALTLVELERWRVMALGSEQAAPGNYAFTPDFSRRIDKARFLAVLTKLAAQFDADENGKTDGVIQFSDLLRDYRLPKARGKSNCFEAVRAERRRVEQQCRARRRY